MTAEDWRSCHNDEAKVGIVTQNLGPRQTTERRKARVDRERAEIEGAGSFEADSSLGQSWKLQ